MVKLLVIADDFTGALDTGVQFRAQKSMVFVYKGDMQKLRKVFLGSSSIDCRYRKQAFGSKGRL